MTNTGVTAKMAKRYGHIGSQVQRAALDALAVASPQHKTTSTGPQLTSHTSEKPNA